MKQTIKINNRPFEIEYKILSSGKKVLGTVRNAITGTISNVASIRTAAKKHLETI